MHVPDIHFHRLRRHSPENGVSLGSHGPEPEFPVIAHGKVVGPVPGVRELPGPSGVRVVAVQLLDAAAVADQFQHIPAVQVLHHLGAGFQHAGPVSVPEPPDAVAAVVQAQAVDVASDPGRFFQLDSFRRRSPSEDGAILFADNQKVASAFHGILHHGEHAVRTRLGVIHPSLCGQVVPMLPVQVHPAEDGLPVQGPPQAGQGLGPVNAVFAYIEGAGAPGKGAHVMLGAVRIQTDQARRRRLSFLDDEVFPVHPGAAGVVRGEGRFPGDLLHRHEGPAGLGLFGPDVVESFLDGPEGLFEGLAGLFPDIALERGDGERMTSDPVEVVGRESGLVIEIPHARDGHVAGGVIVRGGLFE